MLLGFWPNQLDRSQSHNCPHMERSHGNPIKHVRNNAIIVIASKAMALCIIYGHGLCLSPKVESHIMFSTAILGIYVGCKALIRTPLARFGAMEFSKLSPNSLIDFWFVLHNAVRNEGSYIYIYTHYLSLNL